MGLDTPSPITAIIDDIHILSYHHHPPQGEIKNLCHPGACSGPAKIQIFVGDAPQNPGYRSSLSLRADDSERSCVIRSTLCEVWQSSLSSFVIARGANPVTIQLMHYYYKAKFTGLPRSLHSLAMTKFFKFLVLLLLPHQRNNKSF